MAKASMLQAQAWKAAAASAPLQCDVAVHPAGETTFALYYAGAS